MIAIGIGCRPACPAEAIVGLVRRGLDLTGLATGDAPATLFSVVDRADAAGLATAAARLALPLVFLPRAALAAVAEDAPTRSERVVALFGVPSIAETCALAGAGPGARLLLARIAADGATCAIAAPEAAS